MIEVQLNGSTRVFYVVGDPISQVRSPEHLTRIFSRREFNAVLVPAHVEQKSLGHFLAAAADMKNVDGIAVTIPHKFSAFEYCASSSKRATFTKAANVLRKLENGDWTGDNIDGVGFIAAAEAKGFQVSGKRGLLVGCGGAGSAIAYETLFQGAASLRLYDVNVDRLRSLHSALKSQFPNRVEIGNSDPSGMDFIFNSTPMGMNSKDPFPVDVEKLDASQFCGCVITSPEISPWLVIARDKGCNILTGAQMFDAQSERLADFLMGQGFAMNTVEVERSY